MRSRDTSPEAYEIQIRLYRKMTPQRRIELGIEVSEAAFAFMAAGIRTRHPDYTEEEVNRALRRLRLGDDLVLKAWPDEPLVAP